MRLKYIGPSQPLSLTNQRIYDCTSVEKDLVRIIDDEELMNNTLEKLENAVINKCTEVGYLYSILTPIPSGSSEYGIWEIIEDSSDSILRNTMNECIEVYESKGNKFDDMKQNIILKYSK